MKDCEILSLLENYLTISYLQVKDSYKFDLVFLTIKSLVPSLEDIGVDLDYKRFKIEIFYWAYYRERTNKFLDNSLNKEVDPKLYFLGKDDSTLDRIVPIIFANKNFEKIIESSIKSILFTSGNIEHIIETILLAKIIYLLLNSKEEGQIIQALKEEIINLGYLDFIDKYSKYYRVDIEKYNKKYAIEFEREKINALNLLSGLKVMNFQILSNVLTILDMENIGSYEKILSIICTSGVCKEKDVAYISSLSNYLLNLRNSRIDPEALIIKNYVLPDIFKMELGQVFEHSIFNKSKVISKEKKENIECVRIQTKSGIYVLKKPIQR